MAEPKRILSGMRPSGRLHLGHLHGVLKNWLSLQKEYDCFFFVADWHSLTTEYNNAGEIQGNIVNMVIDWLSVGIDPVKSTLFIQSEIKEHAELHLLLSMITPLPWLERNPTYKEQQEQLVNKDLNTYGFLGYPVLQAADIIMYKANGVPVGVDQLPHVELTREIARRFNFIYKEVFPIPEPMLAEVPKLPGIDGRKMSKSYGNAIFLSDTPEEMSHKISQMVTDTNRMRRKDPGDPERCFAFALHRLYFPSVVLDEITDACKKATIGCVECKKRLASAVVSAMEPIREKRRSLLKKSEWVIEILEKGSHKARQQAMATMEEVRGAVWGTQRWNIKSN
ncbi:MAG: tryptophan--tRNA ligase [Desulfovibrionales bacterium]|nr:tryptophan--tRNA ligase [Desulfovibrionales bacterium]